MKLASFFQGLRNRPVIFLLLTTVNAFLAYGRQQVLLNIGIGLAGLAILWTLFRPLNRNNLQARGDVYKNDPAPWLLAAVLLAGIFLRFFKLTSLSAWPLWDEASNSFLAIELAENWRWQFLFSSEQTSPLQHWLQALFYKCVEPGLFSMWLYPSLLSTLTMILGFWTARNYFSRSFSFLYLLLLAFGFWPLYLSKLSIGPGLSLIWQYAALMLLIFFVRSLMKGKNNAVGLALALGLAIGFGFYISQFWLANIPVFILIVLYFTFLSPVRNRKIFIIFFLAVLLPLLPFFYLILIGQYGGHIQNSLSLMHNAPSWGHQIDISMSYLTVLFWGEWDKGFHFGPLWGGLLNPLLASAFLLGLIDCWHSQRRSLFFGGMLLFGIFLLPGLLSNTTEIMRILPILPACLAVVAAGIRGLLNSLPKTKRAFALGLLIFFSTTLDLIHLWGPYRAWAVPGVHHGETKSVERFRAFPILEQIASQRGPGLILSDFGIDVFDQSLVVATYPFNAARNPKFSSDQAQWAALLVPKAYCPYFSKTFPEAKQWDLSEGLHRYDQGLALVVIPVRHQNHLLLLAWTQAHRAIQSVYPLIPYHVEKPSYDKALRTRLSQYSFFQEDRFLKWVFWSKVADFEFRNGNYPDFLKIAERIEKEFYLTSAFYKQRGIALIQFQRYGEAKRSFLTGARLNPRLQPPQDLLKWLDQKTLAGSAHTASSLKAGER
jgi:hypothetical protein